MEYVPVVFTLAELWMLNDFVRHDEEKDLREGAGRYPVVSTALNEDIALALNACHEFGLTEYAVILSYADVLLIDYQIRRDQKTMEGAKGKDILLKVYKARASMAGAFIEDRPVSAEDKTYKEEVKRHATTSDGPDKVTDTGPDQVA